MELTSEQQNILFLAEKMNPGETLKINACAGSGKTSTLIHIMESTPARTFLYLVFNAAMKAEAEKKIQLRNVRICTSHGLAKQELRIGGIVNTYRLGDYAEILNTDYRILSRTRFLDRMKAFIASKATKSSDKEIQTVFEKARNGEIRYSHDLYLKEYQIRLSTGRIKLDRYDYVLLDEAQDTTETVYDIFSKASGRKIMVGDVNQNIYGFRQTINVLKYETDYEAHLTKCFRCKQPILDKAYAMLTEHQHPCDKMTSGFSKEILNGSKAVLCRTNHSIFDILHQVISTGREDTVIIEKNPDLFLGVTVDLYYFLMGYEERAIDKHNIAKFKKIMKQYHLDDFELFFTESLCDDFDLQLAYDTVAQRRQEVLHIYEVAKEIYAHKDCIEGRVSLTTCHMSKGREWDQVLIYKDFDTTLPERIYNWRCETIDRNMKLTSYEKKEKKARAYQEYLVSYENEVNLYYVSMTRAKEKLLDYSWDANHSIDADIDVLKREKKELEQTAQKVLDKFLGYKEKTAERSIKKASDLDAAALLEENRNLKELVASQQLMIEKLKTKLRMY